MSSLAPNDLFSPGGAVLRDPADVEHALAEIWKSAAEEATGHEGSRPKTRVSVANLVVAAPASEWDELLAVLAELSPMVPTRTIMLLITGGPDEPGDITASVSAVCHVPQAGEAQVCCEQIVLRAGTRHVDVLDQTLLPLLESDVPVMGWWRLAPRRTPELFAAARNLAGRLIVDAGPAGFEELGSNRHCAVRELGWYRTYPWREQLARLFDGCPPETVQGVERIQIETSRDTDAWIDACWLVAFLAGQLGWQPSGFRTADLGSGVERTREKVFAFESERGEIEAMINPGTGQGIGLSRLAIEGAGSSLEVQSYPERPEEYRIITCDTRGCQMPRSVQLPRMRRSQAMAAALAGRRVDATFERAWPVAAWMVGHGETSAATGETENAEDQNCLDEQG